MAALGELKPMGCIKRDIPQPKTIYDIKNYIKTPTFRLLKIDTTPQMTQGFCCGL